MTFLDIVEHLPAHVVHRSRDFSGAPLRHVLAGDLMSDVLVTEYDDLILVTSLTTEQTVRTADIVGARGILLVNDKTPQPAMKELAAQHDLTVLSTPLSMFEACLSLGRLLAIPCDTTQKVSP